MSIYQEMIDVMNLQFPYHEWEPVQVITEDNYILNMFHVWSNEHRDPEKGPIFFQHGNAGTGAGWLTRKDNALPIRMANEGHDIYLGNTRGNRFSSEHVYLDPAVDEDLYWDFSYYEMANDILASLEKMHEETGKKGWFIGASQGTQSMQSALSQYDAQLSQYIHRAILLAPCIYANAELESVTDDFTEENVNMIGWELDLGIYVLGGPNWERDLAIICEERPDVCDEFTDKYFGNPIPAKSRIHNQQERLVGRQQTYVEGWEWGNTDGDILDMESIELVPVTMITGELDDLCPSDRAEVQIQRIQSRANFIKLLGVGHGVASTRQPQFFELLKDEITEQYPDEFRSWTVDMRPAGSTLVYGSPSQSLEDCVRLTFECRDAWMSHDPSLVFQIERESRIMKFGDLCPNDANWPNDLCNAEGHCMMSYPYGQRRNGFNSNDAACRTVPRVYTDLENIIFVDDAVCQDHESFCPTCSDEETCKMSYHELDRRRQNGPTAACRCQPN